MPTTFRKKTFTKKIYKKKKFVRKPKVTRNLAQVALGQGFPKKMTITHKYFDSFNMTNVGGGTTNYFFSCNSLFDPNFTGAGHQPLYFDQMAAIYNHYTVIGSKIRVTIGAPTATNTNEIVVLWINDDTSVTPSLTALVEQSSANYTILNFANVDTHTLTKKWSAKKTFGGSVLGNDNLQGTVSSSPTEQSFFQISIFPQDLLSSQAFNVQAHIEYIAVWEELKDIAGS